MSQSMGLKRRERDRTTKSGEGKTSQARLGNEEKIYGGSGRRTLNGAIDTNCKNPGGSSDSKTTGPSDPGLKGEFSVLVRRKCGNESSIITGCDPKEFKWVVSRISNNRIILISEMGFGPVHNFRCGNVNLSLCEMLLNNFDVKNQTIEIRGRHMSITANYFL